jgi:hypothetical protein
MTPERSVIRQMELNQWWAAMVHLGRRSWEERDQFNPRTVVRGHTWYCKCSFCRRIPNEVEY